MALAAWAFASPVGASPDDDFHLISTWCSGSDTSECQPGADDESRVAPLALIAAPCFAFDAEQSAACQSTLLTDEAEPTVETGRGNFDRTYPPAFYAVDGLLASDHIESSVIWIRLLNVAVFIGLAAGAIAVLPPVRRVALTLTWLVTSVPLVTFFIASNNPSSWALTGTTVAWIAWWAYLETAPGHRRWPGTLAVLASVIACGARADAGIYVSLGILCVSLLSWRHVRTMSWATRAVPLATLAGCGAVFLTSGQSEAVGGLHEGEASHAGLSLLANNVLHLPGLLTGGFGSWGLGWLDTAMPPLVLWPAAAAYIGVAFLGLRNLSRVHGIAVGAVAFALAALPLYVLQRGGDVVGANVQPRYVWPLAILLIGLLIARPGPVVLALGRAQIALVGVAVGGAHSVALYTNMRRYITGVDVQDPSLDTAMEWWWRQVPAPSPMMVWAIGSVAFAAAVYFILLDYSRTIRTAEAGGTRLTTDPPEVA